MVRLPRAELRIRFRELRDQLNTWDPLGVMDDPDWPRSEYECLVGPVLRRLEAGAAATEIAAFLRAEVRDHFEVDPEWRPPEPIAEQLVVWFQARWPGTEAAPSSA